MVVIGYYRLQPPCKPFEGKTVDGWMKSIHCNYSCKYAPDIGNHLGASGDCNIYKHNILPLLFFPSLVLQVLNHCKQFECKSMH